MTPPRSHAESDPRPVSERRRHERARHDGPLTVLCAGRTMDVRLRDLSASGLCFFSEEPIGEMTLLDVRLDLPDDREEELRAKGAVVRCERISPHLEHYEVAVFLHEITEAQRARLASFVRYLGQIA
ncbi:MAG: PilZ domain-containing protein [Planctomycetota bacterium]